jgi:hypothetical protein
LVLLVFFVVGPIRPDDRYGPRTVPAGRFLLGVVAGDAHRRSQYAVKHLRAAPSRST